MLKHKFREIPIKHVKDENRQLEILLNIYRYDIDAAENSAVDLECFYEIAKTNEQKGFIRYIQAMKIKNMAPASLGKKMVLLEQAMSLYGDSEESVILRQQKETVKREINQLFSKVNNGNF